MRRDTTEQTQTNVEARPRGTDGLETAKRTEGRDQVTLYALHKTHAALPRRCSLELATA